MNLTNYTQRIETFTEAGLNKELEELLEQKATLQPKIEAVQKRIVELRQREIDEMRKALKP